MFHELWLGPGQICKNKILLKHFMEHVRRGQLFVIYVQHYIWYYHFFVSRNVSAQFILLQTKKKRKHSPSSTPLASSYHILSFQQKFRCYRLQTTFFPPNHMYWIYYIFIRALCTPLTLSYDIVTHSQRKAQAHRHHPKTGRSRPRSTWTFISIPTSIAMSKYYIWV